MGKVNDRGSIKWTAMMMPEQTQMLNEYWSQQEWKEKPILDEQQISDNAMKLQLAIHNNLTVAVKYFKNHDFHTIQEKIYSIDHNSKHIKMDNFERDKVLFTDIIEVSVE